MAKYVDKRAKCGVWIDIEAHLNPTTGAHEFRKYCKDCKLARRPAILPPRYRPELRAPKNDRIEPWTELASKCNIRSESDATTLGKHLSATGASWTEPTQDELRRRRSRSSVSTRHRHVPA